MNINPTSPLSGKPLSECDDREIDAWIDMRKGEKVVKKVVWFVERKHTVFCPACYTTSGDAALALMQTDEWPDDWTLGKYYDDFGIHSYSLGAYVATKPTPAAAIARAWLVAAESRRAEK